jgi:Proline racemase
MAVLSARGLMTEGDVYHARSTIGSEFVCRIARRVEVGGRPGDHADYFRPGLDYRRQPVYARSQRSVALGLSAAGYLAPFKDDWPRLGEAI